MRRMNRLSLMSVALHRGEDTSDNTRWFCETLHAPICNSLIPTRRPRIMKNAVHTEKLRTGEWHDERIESCMCPYLPVVAILGIRGTSYREVTRRLKSLQGSFDFPSRRPGRNIGTAAFRGGGSTQFGASLRTLPMQVFVLPGPSTVAMCIGGDNCATTFRFLHTTIMKAAQPCRTMRSSFVGRIIPEVGGRKLCPPVPANDSFVRVRRIPISFSRAG